MPAQSLDELIAQFDTAIQEVPKLVLKHTEQGALGALALVDLRITEKGINANGAAFEPYTKEYRQRKAGGGKLTQARIEANRAAGRKATAKGRYRGFVDFTLSGQMLASTTTGFERIAPTERSVSGGTARITFDGRDELTRKKLRGNDTHRPDFLQPSKEEVKMVNKAANEGMARDLQAIFQ